MRFLPAVVVTALAGCGRGGDSPSAPPPAAAPARIVSTVPSITATIEAIGADERLVGISTFCPPPAGRDVKRVGGLNDPDVETILALKPDAVFVYTGAPAAAGLRNAGLRVVETGRTGGMTLDDVYEDMRVVGRALGAESERRAEALVSGIRRGIEEVRAAAATRPRRRVLFVVDRDGGSFVVVGRETYLNALLDAAGGENVVGGRHYPAWSLEEVLAAAPEVILESDPKITGDAATWIVPQTDGFWSRHVALPAVKEGRVYRVEAGTVVQPGPRLAEVAQALAKAIGAGAVGSRQ